MIQELKREIEIKEENKVLNRIHEQNKVARMNMQIDRQIKEISKVDSLKKKNIIANILLIIALITIVVLSFKYNEKEISNCIESGNSETFCRYAGE